MRRCMWCTAPLMNRNEGCKVWEQTSKRLVYDLLSSSNPNNGTDDNRDNTVRLHLVVVYSWERTFSIQMRQPYSRYNSFKSCTKSTRDLAS